MLLLLQLIGSGQPKELFYTNSACKQAYMNYVTMLLTRTNTYTGVQYKNDPTIFSFELMVRCRVICRCRVPVCTWETLQSVHDMCMTFLVHAGQ